MLISDWSSDVALPISVQVVEALPEVARHLDVLDLVTTHRHLVGVEQQDVGRHQHRVHEQSGVDPGVVVLAVGAVAVDRCLVGVGTRSEEHTSELQSLMRISYAVFCLKQKTETIEYTLSTT